MLEKIKPAREARENFWGILGVLQGENAQKGVQKGSKKCHKIGEIFWKKIERLLRFLEKIKPRFEIAEISGKNKTPKLRFGRLGP